MHAGLEADDFLYLQHKTKSYHETALIAYAGTIVAEEAFLLFLNTLKRVRQQFARPVELHFLVLIRISINIGSIRNG